MTDSAARHRWRPDQALSYEPPPGPVGYQPGGPLFTPQLQAKQATNSGLESVPEPSHRPDPAASSQQPAASSQQPAASSQQPDPVSNRGPKSTAGRMPAASADQHKEFEPGLEADRLRLMAKHYAQPRGFRDYLIGLADRIESLI